MYKNYIVTGILFAILIMVIGYYPQLLLDKFTTVYSQQGNTSELSLSISGQQQNISWKTYSNDKFGFSVEYPSNWIIQEKTNRFEPGVSLTIKSNEDPTSSLYGQFIFTGSGPSPFSDITINTELGKKRIIDNNFDINYNRQLVEDVNISKYIIDGEKAGSFTYGDSSKATNFALSGSEVVNTIHNGNYYIFQFSSKAQNFDDSQNTAIRTHMFNSIKWLR